MVNFQPEWVAGLLQNGWQLSTGMSGRFGPESTIVYIERVADIGRIGFYLSKYITKDVILSAPKRTRRYTTSRDIVLFKKREPSGWWLTDYSIERLYFLAALNVLTEEFDGDGSIMFFTSGKNIERIVKSY